MPAHHKKIEINEKYLIQQRIISFLLGNGFFLRPPKMSFYDENQSFITIEKNQLVKGIQPIDGFGEAIEYMNTILIDIEKYNKSLGRVKILYEWNYLGQNNEREEYIHKLTEVFWQNQSNEEITLSPNYPDLMENPWKISDFNEIIPDIEVSTDFYSKSTDSFVLKISKDLEQWNYNPYLINNSDTNFQWRISITGQSIVNGSISSQNDQLIHHYIFPQT